MKQSQSFLKPENLKESMPDPDRMGGARDEPKPAPKKPVRVEREYAAAPEAPHWVSKYGIYFVGGLLVIVFVLFLLVGGGDEPTPVPTTTTDSKVSALEAEKAQAAADLAACQSQLAAAPNPETQYTALRTDLQKCTNNLALTRDELADVQKESGASEDIIADAARRLCCMQRVDNPDIDSYSIKNDKIVCSATGDEAITC